MGLTIILAIGGKAWVPFTVLSYIAIGAVFRILLRCGNYQLIVATQSRATFDEFEIFCYKFTKWFYF